MLDHKLNMLMYIPGVHPCVRLGLRKQKIYHGRTRLARPMPKSDDSWWSILAFGFLTLVLYA